MDELPFIILWLAIIVLPVVATVNFIRRDPRHEDSGGNRRTDHVSRIKVPPRDAAIALASVGLALVALFVPWTAAAAECENIGRTRVFDAPIDPIWQGLYLLAFAGVLGAVLVRGGRGAWLAAASAALALAATTVLEADLEEPFVFEQMFSPGAGLPPVGGMRICLMELTWGGWLATVAWALAAFVAWRRAGPRPGWSSRRLAGAALVGIIAIGASWLWGVFPVDALVAGENLLGQGAVSIVAIALFAAAAVIAWGGLGLRRIVAGALFVIGGLMLGGALVPLLRGAALAHAHAALLADRSEPGGLLGRLLVGGLILLVVGAFVWQRARRPGTREDGHRVAG